MLEQVNSVALSADGSLLATGSSDGRFYALDLATGATGSGATAGNGGKTGSGGKTATTGTMDSGDAASGGKPSTPPAKGTPGVWEDVTSPDMDPALFMGSSGFGVGGGYALLTR